MADETPSQEPQQNPQQPEFVRHENFEYWYANNVQLQPTDFDLTMIFGEIDLVSKPGKTIVRQHTAMTISWEEVKLLIHLLQAHLAGREMLYGKVKVPRSLWPPEPIAPTDLIKSQFPVAEDFYASLKRMRDEFIATLE